MKIIFSSFALCWYFSPVWLYGQSELLFDKKLTPGQLVNDVFLGEGAKAGNIRYSGSNNAIAYFLDKEKISGIYEGIFLTTGDVDLAKGPNKSEFTGNYNHMAGDEMLETIAYGNTYDAAVLEFDFVTASDNLMFEFVFCSEEYDEYVGSKYNDVFGFFVNRKGTDETVNIAKLPDRITPITINTVNRKTNKKGPLMAQEDVKDKVNEFFEYTARTTCQRATITQPDRTGIPR